MALRLVRIPHMMSWLYYVGHWGVSLFLFLFTDFRIRGKENVPKRGGVLVSANHLSLMDPPVVGVSLGRTVLFMAKEELFRSRFSGYFVARFGAFPVHRGRLDREALRKAEEVLSRGRALVMFPQGARASSEGYKAEGFVGAAMIASRSDVPVLPMGITGTDAMKGWGWMLRRPRITVTIGQPFKLPASSGQRRREELRDYTDMIMTRIGELLPEAYKHPQGDAGVSQG
jgi:1-acyl-sn-glycerol-3-phosphate acyltransferase